MDCVLLHDKIVGKKKGHVIGCLYPDIDQIVKGFRSVYDEKGYKFFDKGSYNLNIGAVRLDRTISNRFDDRAWAIYKDDNGNWVVNIFNMTTDPGFHYSQNPLNVDGCAILVPGQWKRLWKIGLHKGQEALVQNTECTVYRDNNKDKKIDYRNPQTGFFGINGHRAALDKILEEIGPYSAGCQVWESPWEFSCLLDLCIKSIEIYCSNAFTYTLFEADDFMDKIEISNKRRII